MSSIPTKQKRTVTSWGVNSIDDLRARCIVDDITGCWHWRGGHDGNSRPSLWFPPLGRTVSLGVAIGYLRTGHPPKRGKVWHCKGSCETTDCANPDHRREGTRSTQMIAAKIKASALTRARIAHGKRAKSILSDEGAAEIRASVEPLRVLAERHGISISHAGKIRSGSLRAPIIAGASVFTFARGAGR